MNQSPFSAMPTKWWKRPLIGGAISIVATTVIGGITLGLLNSEELLPNTSLFVILLLIFLFMGTIVPAEIIGLEFDQGFLAILVLVIFWFLAGAVISYLDKNTKRGIFWWVLLLSGLIVMRIIFIGYPSF